jgi:lincosamide nucleotidyltransferase A/C/D/E
MTQDQVLDVLEALEAAGIDAWVDGGWGVDALLGRQTRAHDDLDLVVAAEHVEQVRAMLGEGGFDVERDWLPTALAVRHDDGRAVDVHPIELTPDGGGEQVQPDGSRWHYESPVTGLIGGRGVQCCSLSTQIQSHLGYEPDCDDVADLRALAEHFGVLLPAPYDR